MRFLALALSIFTIIGCNGAHKPLEIVYPPMLRIVDMGDTTRLDEFANSNRFKLIIVSDGNCSACIAGLIVWSDYFIQYRNKHYNNIDLAFILPTDNSDVLYYYLNKFNIKLPVIVDTLDVFRETNILSTNKLYVFLLDKENRIIYDKLPINDIRLFHKQIIKLLKKIEDE